MILSLLMLGKSYLNWNNKKKITASVISPEKWFKREMMNQMISFKSQDKLTWQIRWENHISNWRLKKKIRRLVSMLLLDKVVKESVEMHLDQIDTSQLVSIKDKWLKTNSQILLELQPMEIHQMELHSKSLMPPHLRKLHQNSNLPKILRIMKKKIMLTSVTNAKEE